MKTISIFSLLLLVISSWMTVAETYPGSSCYEYEQGLTREGYLSPTAPNEHKCQTGFQQCLNGVWMGPILYDACETTFKDCDGVAHGTLIEGFLAPNSLPGMECVPATMLCNDGQWEGSPVFPTCFQEP